MRQVKVGWDRGGVRVRGRVGLGLGSSTDGAPTNVLHVALVKVGWRWGYGGGCAGRRLPVS